MTKRIRCVCGAKIRKAFFRDHVETHEEIRINAGIPRQEYIDRLFDAWKRYRKTMKKHRKNRNELIKVI